MQGDGDDGRETRKPSQRASATRVKSQHGSTAATRTTKRKRLTSSDDDGQGDPDSCDDIAHFIVDDSVEDVFRVEESSADEHTSSSVQDEWSYSLTKAHSRGNRPPNKRRRLAQPNVIEISD
jgi:hypothetical protein